jgi:hypothetical protein
MGSGVFKSRQISVRPVLISSRRMAACRLAVAVTPILILGAIGSLWFGTGTRTAGERQWLLLTQFPDSVSQPALSADGRTLLSSGAPARLPAPARSVYRPFREAMQLS